MTVQRRAAATRQRLIDFGVQLFVEKGYLETTPQDIATAAGVTTGAFYYHFASKEDLAEAVIDQGWPKVAAALAAYMDTPGSGIENVISAVFAVVEIINRDSLQWIGFHLNMAIGHLSPQARRAYRERVEAFSLLVPGAFRDSEIRDGISRTEAGELLWIALTGAQLMSDALEEKGAALFDRLAMAWKSALRTIVPGEQLPGLEAFVTETAARYGDQVESSAATFSSS